MKHRFWVLPLMAFGVASCSSTHQHIQQVFEPAPDISGYHMDYRDLENLPSPVQRYFRYAVPDGHPHVSAVRLKHNGWFKRDRDRDWDAISGEQYFATTRPGFLWLGKTRLFQARDAYINNTGSLKVYLFGLIRIVNEKGPHMDQAELLRWLGEAVWFPTAYLPRNDHPIYEGTLNWAEIDNETARLTFEYNGQSVWYDVTINDTGQLIRVETERCFDRDRKERWVGHLGDYRRVDGLMVPMSIEAVWHFEDGEHSYARFHVTELEYDRPEPF